MTNHDDRAVRLVHSASQLANATGMSMAEAMAAMNSAAIALPPQPRRYKPLDIFLIAFAGSALANLVNDLAIYWWVRAQIEQFFTQVLGG